MNKNRDMCWTEDLVKWVLAGIMGTTVGKQHDLLVLLLFYFSERSWTAGVFVGVVFHGHIGTLCYVLPIEMFWVSIRVLFFSHSEKHSNPVLRDNTQTSNLLFTPCFYINA